MSKRTALADHTSDLAIMADTAPSVMVTDAPAAHTSAVAIMAKMALPAMVTVRCAATEAGAEAAFANNCNSGV